MMTLSPPWVDEYEYEYEIRDRHTFLDFSVKEVGTQARRPRSGSCPCWPAAPGLGGAAWEDLKGLKEAETSSTRSTAPPSPKGCEALEPADATWRRSLEDQDTASNLSTADGEACEEKCWDEVYTIMVKNIPCRCSRAEVLAAIDVVGFGGLYDFFYLPVQRGHRQNSGYAFVGFADASATLRFRVAMSGYRFPGRCSEKVVSVVPARIQGLDKTAEHFSRTRALGSKWSPIFVLGDASPVAPVLSQPARPRFERDRRAFGGAQRAPAACRT